MEDKYNYFADSEKSEEERRNAAFQTINAIRESYTLAKGIPVSYEFAYELLYNLDPNAYDSIINILISKNENEIVKFYKEKAEAMSTDDKKVEPLELIYEELSELEAILTSANASKKYHMERRKVLLIAAKEYFTPRVLSEHKSLGHDFNLETRHDYFGKKIYSTSEFKLFKLSKYKLLRLSLLHPDKQESVLGADLVYEHFDLSDNRVRFAHLQYKTWNNQELYASSNKSLVPQLEKMSKHLCQSGFCKAPTSTKNLEFRFPHCSGFLRPTSNKQNPDSKLITTGLHLPICQALGIFKEDKKITKENSKDKSIKAHIFEELFADNIVGSRWITISELESFYSSKNLTSHLNTVRVHAQAIDVPDESVKDR